jgi:hypothetical protein
LRVEATIVCGLTSAVTVGLIAAGFDGWLALASWIVALAAAASSVASGFSRSHLSRSDVLPLLGLTLFAAALRTFRIGEIPFGFWIDEAAVALDARALVASSGFRPFGTTPLLPARPEWVQVSHLYLYACWLVQAASGFSPVGVKLISALPGILAPPALYVLARSLLDRPFALLAGGLLAASSWHVTLSRWGWDEVLATTLCIASFHFAYRAVSETRPAFAAVAGLVAGLALYTYVASIVALFATLTWLAGRSLFDREEREGRNLLAFAAGVIVAALPLFTHWALHPGPPGSRVRELWSLSLGGGAFLSSLWDNTWQHLLMFHVRGDPNPRHHLPGEPLLDPVTGILFAVGVAVALLRWRRPVSQMALTWLGVGLLAGMLSSHPSESPHAYRTGMVAPACFLLAAMGARSLWEWTRERIPRAALPGRVSVAVSVVLAFATADTVWGYFVRRPAQAASWGATVTGVEARMLRESVEAALAGEQPVVLEAQFRSLPLELELELATVAEEPAWANFHGSWERVDEALAEPGVVLILRPQLRDAIVERYPDVRIREVHTPFGTPVAVELHTTRR